MYELGQRTRKRHYKLISLITLVLVLVACVATYKGLHLTATPQSHIHNGTSRVINYQPNVASQIKIDKPLFSVSLPTGWTETDNGSEKSFSGGYYFRSPNQDAQQLSIYIDSVPAIVASNRVLVVTPEGAKIDYATVSDNCTTFTSPKPGDSSLGQTTGLWQGATFTCDTGNYQRDVVSLTSVATPNYVSLNSPKTGPHKVYIFFTDNSLSPQFTVLYGILGSFTLK